MKTLTYSSTSSFKNCRKKYKLNYIDKLEPKERPLYFSIGGAIHLGLEKWYQGNDKQSCIDAITSYMYENEPDIDDDDKYKKFEQSLKLVEMMFNNYIEHYPSEQFEIIEIEKEFTVTIINPETNKPSRNYQLMGKVDGLVKENNNYWILEHKTASTIDNKYIKGLTMDNQSICYLEALERFLSIKIEGIIYNVLLKDYPKPPKVLKSGKLSTASNQKTTPELFNNAIHELGLDTDDYYEYIQYLYDNRKQYFYREYLTFNEKHIQEWRDELWDLQKDISETINKNRFYKNSSQCVSVYGTCQFFDICSSLDEDSIIEYNFNKKSSEHEELKEKK